MQFSGNSDCMGSDRSKRAAVLRALAAGKAPTLAGARLVADHQVGVTGVVGDVAVLIVGRGNDPDLGFQENPRH